MNKFTFNNEELSQIKFALEYLHDSDLIEYGKENIKVLEEIMTKLEIDFEPF